MGEITRAQHYRMFSKEVKITGESCLCLPHRPWKRSKDTSDKHASVGDNPFHLLKYKGTAMIWTVKIKMISMKPWMIIQISQKDLEINVLAFWDNVSYGFCL